MALPCARVCRAVSLILLHGKRPLTSNTRMPRLTCTKSSLWSSRNFSSSQAKLGIGQVIVSKLKWTNQRYERFLQRRFPRFYNLYNVFMTGFRLLFKDGLELRRIKMRMITNNLDQRDLPYREMEKLRQVRRDVIKAIPLVLLSIPPFANYLVFFLMYRYPRQLLIRHFWSAQQLRDFQVVYHSQRSQHHWPVVRGMERTSTSLLDGRLKSRLLELCSKIQSGAHPVVSDVHAVRTLFAGYPLGIKRMEADQMRHLCPLLFLTPRLPRFWVGWRLNNHALELMHLDRAIVRLGLYQLNDAELKEACFVRGLNPESLSVGQCRDWLSQWLQFSTHLNESESSLYLHGMVLFTINYTKS